MAESAPVASPIRRRARAGLAALACAALFAAACGDDGDPVAADAGVPPAEAGTDEGDLDDELDAPEDDLADPEGDGGAAPDGSLVEGGACALLDEAWLTDNLSFEFGESIWEEQPVTGDADRCRWFNDSKALTISVEVLADARADLDDRRTRPNEGTTVEDVDLAPGAFAVRDDFGERYFQIWVPTGEGTVLAVVVDVMQLDDDQLLAVAGEALARARG